MGVIHKLKPEVIKFILDNKQANPHLSCRSLAALLLEKFQVGVSKSSINAIFKENNLSMPTGRRLNPKKKKFILPVLPVIEEVKDITLMPQPIEPILEQDDKQATELTQANEIAREEQNLEEERIREEEIKIKVEAAAKKAEQDKLAAEAQEQARQMAAENMRKQEEARKLEEEKAAQEAALKLEREKCERLAEEELSSKQLTVKEVSLQKNEINPADLLPPNRVCPGAIFLKAVDYLTAGSKQINEIICKRTGDHPENFIALTEAVIFRSLFGPGKDDLALLCSLVGQNIAQEKLDNYYSQIKQIRSLGPEIIKIILNVFTEARGVKVYFIDESVVYLDGQLRTTWPTLYLPYNFASTVYDLKHNLNKFSVEAQPLVLLSAPGYDMPTKEFFNLLLNIGSANRGPDVLVPYGNKLEEFESLSLDHKKNYSLIFGLWPWQFPASRKIKKIGDFNLEQMEDIGKDLYLAEVELDLLQPAIDQSITLKGCAVKTEAQGKIRLIILNSDRSPVNLKKLARTYLGHWPNLEEGFQDFSRKVEVFTYTGSTQKIFSAERLGLSLEDTSLELEEIFVKYIEILDAYLRWHFLPAGYSEKEFSFTKECFYRVPAKLVTRQGRVTAQMQINSTQPSLNDLEYLMRRLNERQINLGNGKTLYFENAFK